MLVYFYLLLLLHITEGCRLEESGKTKPITAYTGDSVLLPCLCTDLHTTPETFTWEKFTNTWVEISPESEQYKDRFQLVNDHSSGNHSLLISHLTVEDAGVYRCSVKGGEFRDFRLTVEGCLRNQQRVTVTGDVGQSVLLPCSCFQLQAKPHTFRWFSGYEEIFPQDQTNRYTDRVRLFNDHHPGNLSLLISHLTVEDGGWYRCQISNNDYKDVLVTVTEAKTTPSTTTRTTTKEKTTSKRDVTPTKSIQVDTPEGGNIQVTALKTENDPHTPTTTIISGVVGVLLLLLLLILGGVMYWKNKGQRRRQTKIDVGQTGQRTCEKKQDVTVPLNLTVTSEPMYEAVDRQNDSEILYATINQQTKHKKAEEQDDVTYSTVLHNNTARAAHTPVASGDTTLYASIKTK